MAVQSRRRRWASGSRRTQPETKWPETTEELNALPDSAREKKPAPKTSSVTTAPTVTRAWPEEHKHPSPHTETPWHQLPLAPASKPAPSNLPLWANPSSYPPKPTPSQFTAPDVKSNTFNAYKSPTQTQGQKMMQTSSSSTPDISRSGMIDPGVAAAQQAHDKTLHGMIDPGVLAAQQAQAKRDKETQDWANTAAIASQMGLATPKFPDGQPTKPESGQSVTNRLSGWTEWDVSQAIRTQWENEHDEEYYPSAYDDMDLTPGDVSYKNPYGIDIDNFLHWAYSQLGYHEKGSKNADLSIKSDENDGSGNYTKYGEDYGVNGQSWCAAFASWCADQAGISENKIFRSTSTNELINSYMNAGRFQPKKSYTPKAGDLVLCQSVESVGIGTDGKYHGNWEYNAEKSQFYWVKDGGHYDLEGHTGIVVGYTVKDGIRYVYTIEGNAGNGIVKLNERKIDFDTYIKGFGINGGSSLGYIPT